MRLGLNLAVFGDRTLEAALDRAVALGLDAVELNTETGDRLTPALSPKLAKRVRESVTSRGLSISALGNHAEVQLIGGPHNEDTDRFFPGSAAEKIAFGKKRLLETAHTAVELGVQTVVGFVGCEDWSRWFPWPDPEGFEKMIPRFADTWGPLLDSLESLGVRFAHEPHPKQLVYDLESAMAVTAALGHHPAWGFNLDTANLSLSGVDPCAFIDELPERIFHVHAKDLEFVPHNLARSGWQGHGAWDRPDRGVRFRVPGWGDVAWKRVFSQLQLAGYEGVVSIEHEDPILSRDEGSEMAVAFLKGILPRQPRDTRWW